MGHSLNQILAVPNWSFFDPQLCLGVRDILAGLPLQIHYVQGDVDHQRTVTAFSGRQDVVFEAMKLVAGHLLPNINLESQHGVHPRVLSSGRVIKVFILAVLSALVSSAQRG